jgi:hypothetical protein
MKWKPPATSNTVQRSMKTSDFSEAGQALIFRMIREMRRRLWMRTYVKDCETTTLFVVCTKEAATKDEEVEKSFPVLKHAKTHYNQCI